MTRLFRLLGVRSRAARLGLTGLAVTFCLMILGGAAAFGYYMSSDSSNPASASADTLPTGATPGTPATTPHLNSNTVTISFSQVSTSIGHVAIPASNYVVKRYPAAGGSAVTTSATCSGPVSGSITCAESSVPDGTWKYTDTPAYGANWVGTESASSASVLVDTTPPTVTATVAGAVSGASESGYIQKGVAYYVYANVSDTGSGVGSVSALVSNITSSQTSSVALVAGNYTAPGGSTYAYRSASLTSNSTQADGQVSYTVNGTDNVGNTSAYSNNGSVVFDSTAPIPTVTAVGNSGYTTSTTPTISGTAGTNTNTSTTSADSATVTVKIYSGATTGGTLVQTLTTTETGGTWSVTPSTALTANAQYTAQASQSDGAGNTGTSSANTFVIDTVAPVPTVTAPAAFINITQPALSGTASTNTATSTTSADSTTVTVKIFAGSGTGGTLKQIFPGVSVTSGNWSVPGSSVNALTANSQYTVQVTQTDGAGNSGSGTDVFVVDTVAPIVSLAAPANGSYTNQTEPSFSGGAGQVAASSTTSADSTTVTVKIYSGATTGGTLVQTLTTTETGGTWSVTPSTALTANAQYTAQASQSDGAGNTGTSSANTFVIDTAVPAPTVTAFNAANATNSTTPSISGTGGTQVASSSASADSTTVTVKIFAGSGTGGTLDQTSTPTVNSGTGAWSVSVSPALTANAQYTVEVTQTDGAGNSGSSSYTFVIDTVAPTGLAVTGNSESGNSGTGSLSGTAGNVAASSTTSADSATVTVKIYSGSNGSGGLLETDTGTRTGTNWTVSYGSVTHRKGSLSATVTQTDGAGNSTTSAFFNFTN